MSYNSLRSFVPLLVLAAFTTLAAQADNPLAEARRLTSFGVDAAVKGLWDEAVFRWRQAVDVYPNFPAAHNNLAVPYENSGEYETYDMSRKNRYVESNSRMFMQFFQQQIAKLEKNRNRSGAEGQGKSENNSAGTEGESQLVHVTDSAPSDVELQKTEALEGEDSAPKLADPDKEVYHKVGSPQQVLIKHPKRETPLSGRFKRVYIAGFSAADKKLANLNFEATEYFRSELRKHTLYDIIPLEELALPTDEDKFYEMVDDDEFWRDLGDRVGADLVVFGRINFYSEPSDGFYPYEYRDYRTGGYRTAQLLIQRTAMTIELDMFFFDSAEGELAYEDSFGQTIVYRGRLDPTLQAFFDVMNRILPRFMGILVPREHDAIRFLLKG